MTDIKYLLTTWVVFGFPIVVMATEPVESIDDEARIESPSVQIARPGQEIDTRIPQKTFTTHLDVLVGGNGEAVRVEITESSGREWIDRRAAKLASEKRYPVRTDDSQPVEYWLENQSYEVTVRAMSNAVDGLPGDPDDDQGLLTRPQQ